MQEALRTQQECSLLQVSRDPGALCSSCTHRLAPAAAALHGALGLERGPSCAFGVGAASGVAAMRRAGYTDCYQGKGAPPPSPPPL